MLFMRLHVEARSVLAALAMLAGFAVSAKAGG